MSARLACAAGAVLIATAVQTPTYLVLPAGRRPSATSGCAPALSRDGGVIAFEAHVPLHASDLNTQPDVYVYDVTDGTIEVASRTPTGQAAGGSWCPSVSEDGQRVLFHSDASDLVPGDENHAPDLFVLDRRAGSVRRVTAGTDPDVWVHHGQISGDGRVAVFDSSDLKRRSRATVMRVSLDAGAGGPTAIGPGYMPAVNRDGSVVAYVIADPAGGPTRLQVVTETETHALGLPVSGRSDGPTHGVALSADGRWATYVSRATNLLPGRRLSGRAQVYLEDLHTGTRQLISATQTGAEGDGRSVAPRVDEDGSTVVFASTAGNFVRSDINLVDDIYCWTRAQPFARPVHEATDDAPWLEASVLPAVSGDGRWATFLTLHPVTEADDRATLDVLLTRLVPMRLTRARQ